MGLKTSGQVSASHCGAQEPLNVFKDRPHSVGAAGSRFKFPRRKSRVRSTSVLQEGKGNHNSSNNRDGQHQAFSSRCCAK